jgi:TPR repeat protein
MSYNLDINKNESNNKIINKVFKELLQELYVVFLDIEDHNTLRLNEFIHNTLLEYDLDPKNVFETMKINSQPDFSYSSLIGIFYQYGIGCEADEIKAFEIFSNAVKNNKKEIIKKFSFDQKNEPITFCDDNIKELNEIITQYFYSLFLYKDIILNKAKNYKLYVKNAENGDSISQYYIGNYYYNKIDYNKAIEWYSKSSEGGNIRAIYKLGNCYYYGYGVMKDEKKALELYLKSAKGGLSYALRSVGDCYYYGRIMKDRSKAFKWYLKAAKKGDFQCQYLVAKWYHNDGIHDPKNEENWFYWNRKVAINGNIHAQFELAEYYLNSNSINKNEKKAFRWYMKLANDNEPRALYIVAKCYRDGVGTDKDLKEAIKWSVRYEESKVF